MIIYIEIRYELKIRIRYILKKTEKKIIIIKNIL